MTMALKTSSPNRGGGPAKLVEGLAVLAAPVAVLASAARPSTILRMVPLPMLRRD
ncbi:hypothetical protein ELI_09525 [Erythrobacter litoralis HTCC2594]|uniref:Uncharacterized protein n=1 Tax=Erythrobacter litoralis (strain HTCC2594) TaxID=314225 RepID=Q2N8J4_ERYLH|nr:hypothetical protein ELI_09525 [Erythrobacter litoralis HTCC2594]